MCEQEMEEHYQQVQNLTEDEPTEINIVPAFENGQRMELGRWMCFLNSLVGNVLSEKCNQPLFLLLLILNEPTRVILNFYCICLHKAIIIIIVMITLWWFPCQRTSWARPPYWASRVEDNRTGARWISGTGAPTGNQVDKIEIMTIKGNWVYVLRIWWKSCLYIKPGNKSCRRWSSHPCPGLHHCSSPCTPEICKHMVFDICIW